MELLEGSYEVTTDLEQFHWVILGGALLPQEILHWQVKTGRRLELALRVSAIEYRAEKGSCAGAVK